MYTFSVVTMIDFDIEFTRMCLLYRNEKFTSAVYYLSDSQRAN